ncbi:MAG: hypothetical protein IK088_00330 [Lachnospiraceae bacterium]|nr:hypothetical protein [Lachnospiraceae bacterium]MBR4767405.1 hypothetical protein [Lachnospiraceae bacterium]
MAYWIRKTHLLRRDQYICSVCGSVSDKPYEVCPNCGAEMDGSEYDPNWVDEIEDMNSMGME